MNPAQQCRVRATHFPDSLDIGLGTASSNSLPDFEEATAGQYASRF